MSLTIGNNYVTKPLSYPTARKVEDNIFHLNTSSEIKEIRPEENVDNLRPDYLYSVVHCLTNQPLHMKYDDTSTKENPVILAIGRDKQGNNFTSKIYVNNVNPENASPVEMIALSVHLREQNAPGKEPSYVRRIASRILETEDVHEKQNFKTLMEKESDQQKRWGFDQIADQYLMDLEYCFSWYLSKKDNVIDTLINR